MSDIRRTGLTRITRETTAEIYDDTSRNGLTVAHLRAFLTECSRRGVPDTEKVYIHDKPGTSASRNTIRISSSFREVLDPNKVQVDEEDPA